MCQIIGWLENSLLFGCQALLVELSLASLGVILKLPKQLVTQLFVKTRCLKRKGIHPRRMATALPGHCFRGDKQPLAPTLPLNRLGYRQNFHPKPAPVGGSDQTTLRLGTAGPKQPQNHR